MNRRAFLASIPLLPAAAKAVVCNAPRIIMQFGWTKPLPKIQGLTGPDILAEKGIEMKTYTLRSSTWTTEFARPERHLILSPMSERAWHEHKLARQLAMPAPNLP